MRLLSNMPVALKALAASAVVLVSLLLVAAMALYSITGMSARLGALVESVLTKQTIKEELVDAAREAHIKLFRYTAWSSNGVGRELLDELRAEIFAANEIIEHHLALLGDRPDLTTVEAEQATLFAEGWKRYKSAAMDTVSVGRLDAPMATMMLGSSDDEFHAALAHLQNLTKAARDQTRGSVEALREEAEDEGNSILMTAVAAILTSLGIILLFARSIVMPIQSVTLAMREIAFGNIDFEPRRIARKRNDEIGQMVAAIGRFCSRMRRDKEMIEKREEELRRQNERFGAALSNMSQGLAMFDADHRLIVCNRRYGEVYGLQPELLQPGTTQQEILNHHVVKGIYNGADPAAFIDDRVAIARRGQPGERLVELADGRIIAISHRPMREGGWVSTHEDITERRRVEAKIAFMATHDALTELPNRLLFRQRLEDTLAAEAAGCMTAVHCLDLDRFKAVNDTLGHPIGDLLLKEVSARLKECAGPTATVARLSGDEFAIIQPHLTSEAEAAALAERIVAAVAAPFELAGHHVCAGTSIGITLSGGDGRSADELLREADTALYRAKSEGRGTFRFFEPAMDESLHNRQRIEVDLRNALAKSQLELHYQPIVNVESGDVVAFEALLRWRHPERGMIPPNEFVPVAEDIGLIEQIGGWVLRQACMEAASWPEDVRVAVNLSPVQFGNQALVSIAASALAEAGLAPSRLEIEITESVLLLESPATLSLLHRLRELGIRIAMDDFGTGYSSLSYLRSFPFDKVKIDRCFIQELPTDGDSGAIVRAMIELAQSLGMTTTAEGVETAEQLEHLKRQGCGEAQGYHFSAACPPEEIPHLLARWASRRAA